MFYDLLQINLAFVVLYLVYALFFSRLTFYGLNRVLLLLVFPLSLILSLLPSGLGFMPQTVVTVQEFHEVWNDGMTVVAEHAEANSSSPALLYAGIAYGIIVLILMLRLIIHVIRIIQLKRTSAYQNTQPYCLIRAEVASAFSVFHWIFLPKDSHHQEENLVIAHEWAHARCLHTLDLIYAELLVTLFWFNPFVYFFRRSLKRLHEYQADAMVISDHQCKSEYLQLMLGSLVSPYKSSGLTNSFNGSTFKNRIKMITKDKSSIRHALLYALLLPVVAVLTLAFSDGISEVPSFFPLMSGTEYKITAEHGKSFRNPLTQKMTVHKGIDLAAKEGTAVLSAAGGTVVKASMEDGYGNLVIIDHGDGYTSWYAHLLDITVTGDQKVSGGQVIGHVGSTGRSTGPHLHFEIRKDDHAVNPFEYITME